MRRFNKQQIIEQLGLFSALLEFHGANKFKVRAFDNAAAALGSDPASMEELTAESRRLEELEGIGPSTAALIRELYETGKSHDIEKMLEAAPRDIEVLMTVPQLGPKKIRVLYDALGIESIADLEVALSDGRVAEVPGFGGKTVEKILNALELFRESLGLHLLSTAEETVAPVMLALRDMGEVIRVEVAGSLRRKCETIGDVDLVASSGNPAQVISNFTELPHVLEVVELGRTQATVFLNGAVKATLRVVGDDEFAPALFWHTGNGEHVAEFISRAGEKNLRVEECGIFRTGPAGSDDNRLVIKTEQEIYALLEMDTIEPELREGRGELNAAAAHALPTLVTREDYRGVLHVHSTWSDGQKSIREMARAALQEQNCSYLGICDHSEVAVYAGGVKREDIARQHKEIDAINEEMHGDAFRVLKGCECDILADGSLDYSDEILSRMDFVVASVHSRFNMSAEEMTERLLAAVENPYTTILGHLTGRLLLSRSPYAFDMNAVLQRCADTGTIVEINADPHRLDLDWSHIHAAAEMGVRFAVNPDAHSTEGLDNIHYGISIARKGWLAADQVINTLSAEEFLKLAAEIRAEKMKSKK
ncbi:DNA polymerase/3'-5' exonuclease PolX [candidate division BRC1 bacterium HGW-BRC1-1]|jgi:DNA polymerase (family 10)|nr:MAG: DNA polymerase/3'-5' exonuclease PolX [candidate division BRC1 bacterium HGW-BRC1-1]